MFNKIYIDECRAGVPIGSVQIKSKKVNGRPMLTSHFALLYLRFIVTTDKVFPTNFVNHLLYQEYLSELGSQTAEPQRIAATTTIQTQPPAEDQQQSNSTVRKYLGSRSPSGQSPVTKSRKTPQNVNVSASSKESSDREIGSPKSRTWKGLVARQFRKIQGQPSSPNSNYAVLPEGASIGVPLAQCPMVIRFCKAKLGNLLYERFNRFSVGR